MSPVSLRWGKKRARRLFPIHPGERVPREYLVIAVEFLLLFVFTKKGGSLWTNSTASGEVQGRRWGEKG